MLKVYLQRILKGGMIALSVFYLLSMLWIFSRHLVYPYELDWIEGGILTSVLRIVDGHHLYSAPSIEYVPFLYAPVFFYVSALLAKITGASLLTLRLVSSVATLVSLLTIALIVFGETKSWLWAIISAGLFAGLYPASRFWFDMARVDALFVMFFLLFLFCLQRGDDSVRWQIAAGTFAALTMLTKQNGLTMCLPAIAVYFVFGFKRRWVLPLTFALVFGLLSLILIVSSDGWYLYYCYSVALLQPNVRVSYSVFEFIKDFILDNVGIAGASSLFVLSFWFFRAPKDKSLRWLTIFATTLITSYIAKANVGAVNNVVMPTFAVVSVLFGVCCFEVSKLLNDWSNRYRALIEIFFCILVLIQLGQVVYNPALHIPSLEDYRSGERALKLVKKFDGNVYVPNSSLALLAGKRSFAHPAAIWDVMHTNADPRGKTILAADLKKAVDTRLFDAIIVMPGFNYFPHLTQVYVHDRAKYILLDDNWKEKLRVYILP